MYVFVCMCIHICTRAHVARRVSYVCPVCVHICTCMRENSAYIYGCLYVRANVFVYVYMLLVVSRTCVMGVYIYMCV